MFIENYRLLPLPLARLDAFALARGARLASGGGTDVSASGCSSFCSGSSAGVASAGGSSPEGCSACSDGPPDGSCGAARPSSSSSSSLLSSNSSSATVEAV